MCLATVYLGNEGHRKEVMRDVAWVQAETCGLRLVSLMGQSRLLQAEIIGIDLLHSSIVLREAAAGLAQDTAADPKPKESGRPARNR